MAASLMTLADLAVLSVRDTTAELKHIKPLAESCEAVVESQKGSALM